MKKFAMPFFVAAALVAGVAAATEPKARQVKLENRMHRAAMDKIAVQGVALERERQALSKREQDHNDEVAAVTSELAAALQFAPGERIVGYESASGLLTVAFVPSAAIPAPQAGR